MSFLKQRFVQKKTEKHLEKFSSERCNQQK